MLFSIYINQKAAIEWGLNLNQAAVFSVIYSAAAWADKRGDYWNLSKGKIIDELPLLTDKVDTVYRLQKQLIDKGLIEKKVIENKDFFRLTQKGLFWAVDKSSVGEVGCDPASFDNDNVGRKYIRGSENNPSEDVFLPADRKNIRQSSEINPADLGNKSDVLVYQDKYTNINLKNVSGNGEEINASWRPDEQICIYCRQVAHCSDDEFELCISDFKLFWTSRDGLSRNSPRDWHSNFKRSFVRILNTVRSDKAGVVRSADVSTKNRSIGHGLTDMSWAN